MKVVRFLERKEVIRFFGVALVLAPFINFLLHAIVIKSQAGIAWSEFQWIPVLSSMNVVSFILAASSIAIGFIMLSGQQKAWKYLLFLIGTHIVIQVANVGNTAWKGPLAWPSFILNTALFFFIVDQLVWKVKPAPQQPEVSEPAAAAVKNKVVVNLKSYRKILFSFGSDQPWGELKSLSSELLSVKRIAEVPSNIDSRTVQINFSRDVVVDIQFLKQEDEMIYFKPLNMDKEKVTNLNKWLRKIAV
ncbi:MAG: hypothetical protein ACXVAX_04515 [Pseudobdellovibrio sp.]